MENANETLQRITQVGEWVVTFVLLATGLYDLHLGAWIRSLLGLSSALMWAPSIKAHPVLRLIAIMVGFQLL